MCLSRSSVSNKKQLRRGSDFRISPKYKVSKGNMIGKVERLQNVAKHILICLPKLNKHTTMRTDVHPESPSKQIHMLQK